MGCEIVSSDGHVGRVDDILFDERSWTFRYVVADVGQWLPGRQVLLSFETIQHFCEDRRELHFPLTKRAIELSPDVSTQNPISMEAELLLGKYWQWTTYWETRLPRTIGKNISDEATLAERQEAEKAGKSHLRSVREVEGYHIEATDGDIGHLKDLVIEDGTWQIEYLVVDAGIWLFQRKLLIPCVTLENIRWADKRVHVAITRAEIKNSPEYDPKLPITRDYEQTLHDRYGKQPYWQVTNPLAETTPNAGGVRQEPKEPDLRGVVIPKILK
jgi:uncharacterized protein YrrD